MENSKIIVGILWAVLVLAVLNAFVGSFLFGVLIAALAGLGVYLTKPRTRLNA